MLEGKTKGQHRGNRKERRRNCAVRRSLANHDRLFVWQLSQIGSHLGSRPEKGRSGRGGEPDLEASVVAVRWPDREGTVTC